MRTAAEGRTGALPEATFALASPVTVSASAVKGTVAHVNVAGTFTIHGAASHPLYLNLSFLLTGLVPAGVETVMSTVPAPAGEMAVIVLEDSTL